MFSLVSLGRLNSAFCRDGSDCDAYPWGLPHLHGGDFKKVLTGNRLLQFACRLIRLCEALRVPYAVENPRSSRVWEMSCLQRIRADFSNRMVHVDYCQYGEPWRKPTSILYNFLDLNPAAATCSPFQGVCSYSMLPHVALKGQDTQGVFWTLRAQPYPRRFAAKICDAVANTLSGYGRDSRS